MKKSVYLIGIGGMAAAYLVDLALAAGYEVAGSDAVAGEATDELLKKSVRVLIGHNADHVTKSIDEIWYSSAITETSDGYCELEQANKLGIPTLTFAQAAAEFFNRATKRVAIAGTHGKSTTTAMVGWILAKAGKNPTVALGARMNAWHGNARVGDPDLFIVEADEYAKRFLEYHPTHAIVTSMEGDHFDTYPTEADLRAGFEKFAGQIEQTLVINNEVNISLDNGNNKPLEMIEYGLKTEQWRGEYDVEIEKNPVRNGKIWAIVGPRHLELSLLIPGVHNLLNATAAVALCKQLDVPEEVSLAALAEFPGVARRFERVGQLPNDVLVYDDYGHHPTAITATLTAAKQFFPDYHIILVHQPHQAGRIIHLMDATAKALCHADEVVLLPVYTVRGRESEHDIANATSEALSQAMKKHGSQAVLAFDYEEAAHLVKQRLKPKTLVLTMGATDVYKVGRILVK